MNVLITWLWYQWKRYIDYFLSKKYCVYWICKSYETKKKLTDNYNIIIETNINKFSNIKFDIAVVALPSNIQWEFILYNLDIFSNIKKVLIEMPITKNDLILEKLKNMNNFYFFLEEYNWFLNIFLRKINYNIKNLDIKNYINDNDEVSLENNFIHIKNNFLWSKLIIPNESINVIKKNVYNIWDLNYEISFSYKDNIIYYNFDNNWISLLINWKKYKSYWSFEKNIEKILNLNSSYKKLYFLK